MRAAQSFYTALEEALAVDLASLLFSVFCFIVLRGLKASNGAGLRGGIVANPGFIVANPGLVLQIPGVIHRFVASYLL